MICLGKNLKQETEKAKVPYKKETPPVKLYKVIICLRWLKLVLGKTSKALIRVIIPSESILKDFLVSVSLGKVKRVEVSIRKKNALPHEEKTTQKKLSQDEEDLIVWIVGELVEKHKKKIILAVEQKFLDLIKSICSKDAENE